MAKKPPKLKPLTEQCSLRDYLTLRRPFDTDDQMAARLGYQRLYPFHGQDRKTQIEYEPDSGVVIAINGKPTEAGEKKAAETKTETPEPAES